VSVQEKKVIPYGYIADGDIFLSGQDGRPDRKIGVVKESEDASIAYFINKFMMLKKKFDDLHDIVKKSQNKGSFLMKLQHLRESIPTYDGLGDYRPLFKKIELIEQEIKSIVGVNRERNLEIKLALLEEAKPYKDVEDWKQVAPFFRDFKMRWLKTGRVLEAQEEEVESAFQEWVAYFNVRKEAYLAELNIELAAKAVKFDEIIAKAEELKDNPNLKFARFQFHKLFQDWKSLGKVPKSEEYDPWATFRDICDYFYKRVKESKPERPHKKMGRGRSPFKPQGFQRPLGGDTVTAPRQEGTFQRQTPKWEPQEEVLPPLFSEKDRIDYKLKLCQRAEALRNADARTSLEQAKHLQELWKKSGLVPRHKKRELQDRFRNAVDVIYQKRSIYVNARKMEEHYTELSKPDQIKTQIIVLKGMIKEDERELVQLEEEAQQQSGRTEIYTADKLLAGKVQEQRRKIQVKLSLLQELELQYLAAN
jgi:hypothetical protein